MSVEASEIWGERLAGVVVRQFGLRFEESKFAFLADVLSLRCQARQLSAAHYLDVIEGDLEECRALATHLTVGETHFFRNADQFRAFTEQVLPDAMRDAGPAPALSFLSAGCSSGEEPYTLAMLARTSVPTPWRISIRAVDLNPAALARAAVGRYGPWSLRELPEAMRERWFKPAGRDLELDASLRGMVDFGWANLADPQSDVWRPAAYHAIFCRNVIMYFAPAVQSAVVERLAEALVPGGYLFLGHAETLRGLSQAFHLIHTHGTFYYQRRRPGEAASALYAASRPVPQRDWRPPVQPAPDTSWYETIGAASRRIEALLPSEASEREIVPTPHWNLETVLDLLRRERFAEALELMTQRPDSIAADPDVLLLEALLLLEDGQLDTARNVCTVLLSGDELNAGAQYVVGLCFEGRKDQQRAAHHYGIASHFDPRFAMPRLRGGLLARRAGRLADARRDLEVALELLQNEDTSRLLMFGGGFTRTALLSLCEGEIRACGMAA